MALTARSSHVRFGVDCGGDGGYVSAMSTGKRSLAGRLPFAPQLDAAFQKVRGAYYRGDGFYCPVCDTHSREFLSYGGRPRAACPQCGALERHRGLWLYLTRHTDLLDGTHKRVLHVAPEQAFVRHLRRAIGAGYITADLSNPKAMLPLDICENPFKNDFFDVVLCNHVLEHVPDDRLAMREFLRVLKPGGWACFLVPIKKGQKTLEDPTVTDPEERARLFGQWDHLRFYGEDFADRLSEQGFVVEVVRLGELFSEHESQQMQLRGHLVFICRKRPAASNN